MPTPAFRRFRAPGRVNLIGEHTDYNDGFVMPAALGFAATVTATPRADHLVSVSSREHPGPPFAFPLTVDATPRRQWTDYVQGAAIELLKAGYPLTGMDLAIESSVPIGAGLSSSAALEVSAALALAGLREPTLDLARVCQLAENNFIGMRCGIMDQFAACFGQAGHALLLDCRSLTHTAVPLPPDLALVVCNSLVKHELQGSEYNDRRADCEAGARAMGVPALRDADLARLDATNLPGRIRKRCRHVITENGRVHQMAAALARRDYAVVADAMRASHESLRDDYEVSCPELDLLVDAALAQPGVRGARMTGGGFGGCTVNLVEQDAVESFRHAVAEGYLRHLGFLPEIYVCEAGEGAGEVLEGGA